MENNLPTPENKPSLMKRLLKVVLYSLLFLLLLCGGLILLLFVYEDEVKAAILKELNKHLKSEVRVDPKDINLTIIKTFPDCSIEFKRVLMLEALPLKQRDTLLFAGELNFYFDIGDLWNKRYNIKSIKLNDAVLKPTVLKNGKNNYTFWSEPESTQNKNDSIQFDLQLLKIENTRVLYKDRQSQIKVAMAINELEFKGHFSENDYTLLASGQVRLRQITHQNNSVLKEKELTFETELAVKQWEYVFKKANMSLNEMKLQLTGAFTYKDSLQRASLNYNAPNLDISSVISLLPAAYSQRMNDYKSDGNFYARGSFNYQNNGHYQMESAFGIKNGEITYKPLSTMATNISMDGTLKYSNHQSQLEINTCYFKLNADEVKARFTLHNFEKPAINLSLDAALQLESLQNFWPIDTLTKLSGRLNIKTTVSGKVEDLKSKTFSDKVTLELDASVSQLEAQFKGDEKVYAVENCSLSAHEREIMVHDLKLKRGSSDIKVNGKMPGVFNYLADRSAPLIIQGNLFSENIQLEDFLPETKSGGNGAAEAIVPKGVEFKLDAAILNFGFAKFKAKSITGNFEIKNQKAMVSDMKLETMKGEAEINAYADNSKGKLDVVLQSDLKGISIEELFFQFNNFGQGTLIDKNLKGFATMNINLSGSWNNALEADYNSLRATADIAIERGELINFEPLNALSKYLDINDLKHIKFSMLQSQVELRDRMIFLPNTSIKNSALNIELAGTHDFDNRIDYHLRLLNRDYKAKKNKNKQDEFSALEYDEENNRMIFIKMKGTVDNPKIEYDVKGMTSKIKDDVKQEKQNLKQILKEEFGIFKKDSLKPSPKKQERVLELEKPATKKNNQTPPKKNEEDDGDF